MTDKPSIESLRKDAIAVWRHAGPCLDVLDRVLDAIEELERARRTLARADAYEGIPARSFRRTNCEGDPEYQRLPYGDLYFREDVDVAIAKLMDECDDLRAEVEALRVEKRNIFRHMERAEEERDTERSRANALAARVEALRPWVAHLEGCSEQENGPDTCDCGLTQLLNSTPAADLEAHDARVRREALEGAWERIESEPEFPGEMPTEVWRQTRDATKEQFEAAMRGLLRAWKAKAKVALFGTEPQKEGK